MADRRISELPVIPAVAGDDALAIVDTSLSETNKVSVESLLRSAPAGTAAAPSIAFVDDPDTGFYRSAANELSIGTAGTQRVVVDSAGNVGIGTSSPTQILQLKDDNATLLVQDSATSFSQNQAGILLTCSDVGGAPRTDIQRKIKGDGDNLVFTYGASDTEHLRIDDSGNVGIGTSNPGAELEISSDLPQFRLTDETDSSYAELLNNNGSLSVRADESNVAGSSYMDFRVDGSERMRIDSSGNVGIGTSNPQRPLQINAAVAAIRLKDTDTTSYTEIIQDFGVTQLNQVNGGNIRFGVDGERMRITSTGNVGIGTSSPGAKLEVNGTIKATDINFTGLATYADDTAAGTGGLVAGDVYKTSTGELRIKL